jgi:hypothetical protein
MSIAEFADICHRMTKDTAGGRTAMGMAGHERRGQVWDDESWQVISDRLVQSAR